MPDSNSRVTTVPSAVALSSSARLAMFRNTSSRVASPSCMSEIPNSDSLYCSSSKKPYPWRNDDEPHRRKSKRLLELLKILTAKSFSLSWGITKVMKAFFSSIGSTFRCCKKDIVPGSEALPT